MSAITLLPPELRRSWLFLPGADRAALSAGPATGADVLVQELETFCVPAQLPQARGMMHDIMNEWRSKGVVTSIRINLFEKGGYEDLRAAMAARPDIIMMALVSTPEQIRELDQQVTHLEQEFGIPEGTTEIVPNIELALGLVNTMPIARASKRVSAMLVGAEDMVADLGAERTRAGRELDYVRSRFLVECTAVRVTAIDCPYVYADFEGAEADMRWGRSIGYRAKGIVNPQLTGIVNACLRPTDAQIDTARKHVEAFNAQKARAAGKRFVAAVTGDVLVEIPDYMAALRLLQRAGEFESRSQQAAE